MQELLCFIIIMQSIKLRHGTKAQKSAKNEIKFILQKKNKLPANIQKSILSVQIVVFIINRCSTVILFNAPRNNTL